MSLPIRLAETKPVKQAASWSYVIGKTKSDGDVAFLKSEN
nr:MAG TPA: hypothetical protein [Caudoviricetes sp.]